MKVFKYVGLFVLLVGAVLLAGCARPADVASKNLSLAADNFQVARRIVFYNGITDSYMLTIEGLCSLGNFDEPGELTVTCKVGPSNPLGYRRLCKDHAAVDYRHAWACPDCLVELRERNRALVAALRDIADGPMWFFPMAATVAADALAADAKAVAVEGRRE